MKAAILSLFVAIALATTAGFADAQPPRYYNPRPVIVYPSVNSSPYAYGNVLHPSANTPYFGGYLSPYGYNSAPNYGTGLSPYGYNSFSYNNYNNYNSYPPPYVGGYVIPWR